MNSLVVAREAQLVAQGSLADWGEAARDWADNLSSERTRRAYLASWQDFLAFAETSPALVTKSDVIAYRRHLKTALSDRTGRPLSQSTINQRLSALSSFFTFAQEAGLRADNPTEGVKREAVTPYGKATWLDAEAGEDLRLLEAIDASTAQGKRDRAVLLLFLTLALRVREVAGLKVGSLRRQGSSTFLTYTRKGGATEEVPLATAAALAIDDYLKTREGLTPDSPLFVATQQGREAARRLGRDVDHDSPLTSRAVAYMVKARCNQVFGAGHGIHPHSLRHTAAQVRIAEGGSVTDVSRLLKHSSTAITSIYMHATSGSDKATAQVMNRRYSAATEEGRG